MSAVETEVIEPEPEPQKKTRSRALVRREETLPAAPANDGQMLQTLMTEAIRSGNRELMREVMEIRRELKGEAAREAFFAALSSFQSECPIIKKNKSVKDGSGSVRYNYAPLDAIVRIVAPLLTKFGLSYTIESKIIGTGDESSLEAICMVYHEAGHMESSRFSVPVELPKFMSKPQTFGAASTFAKRYAFVNALGILTGDDDNDARISPNEARAQRQPVSQPRQTPTAQRAEAEKATARATGKVALEPAGDGEGIDANTIRGLTAAMTHAGLDNARFKERFPQLAGLEQVKKTDSKTILSWIADPNKN